MDPNACVRRIVAAAEADDRQEYTEACKDLAAWLKNSGFKPATDLLKWTPGTNTAWSIMPPEPHGKFKVWTLVHWAEGGSADSTYPLE
jgi:hypothetical protein